MNLRLASDLGLPLDAVTQTFAFLAKRRVGKTYTASVLAEEFVAACLPFVVIDPTGAWWGLRASADGKGPGLPVIVIGGAHGDLPLDPDGGAAVAELVVEHPGYYILDLSGTRSNAEQDRFCLAFAERLYRLKQAKRDPLHLFVDEADAVVPQKPQRGQERLLGAFEALVRRGGVYGIGVSLISQRAAVTNKNVLTQTEVLVALQTTAPQDRAAIMEWAKGHGTPEQVQALAASLASLGRGEAWIWSPTWLETFRKVRIRERHTFNSSATPKIGDKVREPKVLAAVDLEALRARMAETIKKAKENDPALLRRQIAELQASKSRLEADLKKVREKSAYQAPKEQIVPAFKEIHLKRAEATACRLENALVPAVAALKDLVAGLVRATEPPRASLPPVQSREIRPPAPVMAALSRHDQRAAPPRPYMLAAAEVLGKGEQAILRAVAQHANQGGATREQLTILTGYKRSSRDTYIQRLKQADLVHDNGSVMTVTEYGMAQLGTDFEPLPTGDALRQHWLQRLSGGEKVILQILLQAYPQAMTRESISESTSYQRSSRDTYLQRLAARKLVIAEGRGSVKASDILFQEAAA